MIQSAKKANVILFVINHITQKLSTGFLPTPAQIAYLGQDESLPGGTASLYLANNLIKIKNAGKLKPEEAYGIRGFIGEIMFIKSRTNSAGVPVELIYEQTTGYQKVLSLFHFAYKNKLMEGSTKMYFACLPDIKFTRKDFLSQVYEHPELLNALYETCLPALTDLLSDGRQVGDGEETEEERIKAFVKSLSLMRDI